MMEIIDFKSIGLFGLTMLGFLFGKADVLFGITVLVGMSTVAYNGVRIYKALKK
jgi:hypothetical protein